MSEITRGLIARVGVDLAKQVIQVHAVDAAGRKELGKRSSAIRSCPGVCTCLRAAWVRRH